MTAPAPHLLHYDLGPDVTAFSTGRAGGCSEGNYASFNVNEWCGDSPEHVQRNREALTNYLNLDLKRLVIPHQTHQTRVRLIDEVFLVLDDAAQRAEWLEGVDALVTRLPDVCIGVSTADCIPLLLYDASTHTVAAIHAGWRGTVSRIVEHTLDFMTGELGVQPATVRAAIGPGISQAAFEVGEEVYEAFASARFPMERIAMRHPRTGKWHIDLKEANRLQLLAKGVLSTHIVDSCICTKTSADRFFSARTLGVHSGRIFNGIMLRG